MRIIKIVFLLIICCMITKGDVFSNEDSTVIKKEEVNKLIALIKSEPKTEIEIKDKEEAIKQVAQMDTPNVIIMEVLLDNILFLSLEARKRVPLNPMGAKKYAIWPAYDVLKNIGNPVIPVAIGKLKTTDDPKLRQKYKMLLVDLAGEGNLTELLKTAISQTTGKKELERLKEALNSM